MTTIEQQLLLDDHHRQHPTMGDVWLKGEQFVIAIADADPFLICAHPRGALMDPDHVEVDTQVIDWLSLAAFQRRVQNPDCHVTPDGFDPWVFA